MECQTKQWCGRNTDTDSLMPLHKLDLKIGQRVLICRNKHEVDDYGTVLGV